MSFGGLSVGGEWKEEAWQVAQMTWSRVLHSGVSSFTPAAGSGFLSSEIFCGHRRRDSKFSVGCENRRHRLGLGLFLWSSEDWMQKKDRNQRRPGRRRAEDVAWESRMINHWSDQPADDQLVSSRSYPATTGQPDADYSSRLFRTRYRPGQLDTWFWVVLLRVLRFPPPF